MPWFLGVLNYRLRIALDVSEIDKCWEKIQLSTEDYWIPFDNVHEVLTELKENALHISAKKAEDDTNRTYLHRGIATRAFERRFTLADHVKVTGASHENGMLHIDLMREVPEALKPRRIAIRFSTGPSGSSPLTKRCTSKPSGSSIACITSNTSPVAGVTLGAAISFSARSTALLIGGAAPVQAERPVQTPCRAYRPSASPPV